MIIQQAHISGRDWKYIVGQIPLAGNAHEVWQMIWGTNAKIIVVLERDSTALFYPADPGVTMSFDNVRLSVVLLIVALTDSWEQDVSNFW